MKMTDAEKLILSMVSEIHEQLKIKDGIDSTFVKSAIYEDKTWGLYWGLPGLFPGNPETPAEVREVVDILEMWEFIEHAYTNQSREDKDRIVAEAEPFGRQVSFRGFDGNGESEQIGITRFLMEHLDRFTRFKGRELNSHMPMLDSHRRMLSVFTSLRPSLKDRELTTDELITILKEWRRRASIPKA